MQSGYYDKTGKQLKDVIEWANLLDDTNYRHIGDDTINGYRVSTVWIGIDHVFAHGHRLAGPYIFETMIFAPGTKLHQFQWRSDTEENASLAHRAAVEIVKNEPPLAP